MPEDSHPASEKRSTSASETSFPTAPRKGQQLFWVLLFSPTAIMMIGFIPISRNYNNEPTLFFISMAMGLLICIYCALWTARGWSKEPGIIALFTILMTLAYVVLNVIAAFAGCMAVFNL